MFVKKIFSYYDKFYINLINREHHYEITLLKVERVEKNIWNHYMIATIQVLKGTCKYDLKTVSETKGVKLDIRKWLYLDYGEVEYVCYGKIKHYATNHRLASFSCVDFPDGVSDKEYCEREERERERRHERVQSKILDGMAVGIDIFKISNKYRFEIDKARIRYFKGEITKEEYDRKKSFYQELMDKLWE